MCRASCHLHAEHRKAQLGTDEWQPMMNNRRLIHMASCVVVRVHSEGQARKLRSCFKHSHRQFEDTNLVHTLCWPKQRNTNRTSMHYATGRCQKKLPTKGPLEAIKKHNTLLGWPGSQSGWLASLARSELLLDPSTAGTRNIMPPARYFKRGLNIQVARAAAEIKSHNCGESPGPRKALARHPEKLSIQGAST